MRVVNFKVAASILAPIQVGKSSSSRHRSGMLHLACRLDCKHLLIHYLSGLLSSNDHDYVSKKQ